MTPKQILVRAAAGAAFIGIGIVGMLINSSRLKADENENGEESRVKIGFAIAPVHLNLEGKNRALVGLGSYLVNAAGDCNACHNPGPGNNQFLSG